MLAEAGPQAAGSPQNPVSNTRSHSTEIAYQNPCSPVALARLRPSCFLWQPQVRLPSCLPYSKVLTQMPAAVSLLFPITLANQNALPYAVTLEIVASNAIAQPVAAGAILTAYASEGYIMLEVLVKQAQG